jgi:hypothetical protein
MSIGKEVDGNYTEITIKGLSLELRNDTLAFADVRPEAATEANRLLYRELPSEILLRLVRFQKFNAVTCQLKDYYIYILKIYRDIKILI